jgi:hypothetical protein
MQVSEPTYELLLKNVSTNGDLNMYMPGLNEICFNYESVIKRARRGSPGSEIKVVE